MMASPHNPLLLLILVCLGLSSCKPSRKPDAAQTSPPPAPQVYRVAFGSCAYQGHDLPIFHEVIRHKPNVFVFLGDNIYGDTNDMDVLRQKYQQLGNKPSYIALKKSAEILATWDDHDYGRNDAGKHYPHKEESKQVFLEFFEEPRDSERYKHEGIYTSVMKHVGDKTVQFLILDGRTFRDDLKRNTSKAKIILPSGVRTAHRHIC